MFNHFIVNVIDFTLLLQCIFAKKYIVTKITFEIREVECGRSVECRSRVCSNLEFEHGVGAIHKSIHKFSDLTFAVYNVNV